MVVVGNSGSAIGGAMFTGCVACSPRNARSRGVPWRDLPKIVDHSLCYRAALFTVFAPFLLAPHSRLIMLQVRLILPHALSLGMIECKF
jgi:hypothetical protein